MTPTRSSAGPALSSKTTAATSSTGSHSSSESSRIAAGLCERTEPDGEADLPSSHPLAAGCLRSSVRALYSPSGSSSSSPAALTCTSSQTSVSSLCRSSSRLATAPRPRSAPTPSRSPSSPSSRSTSSCAPSSSPSRPSVCVHESHCSLLTSCESSRLTRSYPDSSAADRLAPRQIGRQQHQRLPR